MTQYRTETHNNCPFSVSTDSPDTNNLTPSQPRNKNGNVKLWGGTQ
jgi:hypothetical protein